MAPMARNTGPLSPHTTHNPPPLLVVAQKRRKWPRIYVFCVFFFYFFLRRSFLFFNSFFCMHCYRPYFFIDFFREHMKNRGKWPKPWGKPKAYETQPFGWPCLFSVFLRFLRIFFYFFFRMVSMLQKKAKKFIDFLSTFSSKMPISTLFRPRMPIT